jgi:hypothetical protein
LEREAVLCGRPAVICAIAAARVSRVSGRRKSGTPTTSHSIPPREVSAMKAG